MKYFTKLFFGITLISLPVFAMADTATTSVPVHLSPLNNAILTSSLFTSADWTDVTVGSTSASYNYESSLSTSTKVDGSFVTPVFASSLLASSSISTASTGEGIYYWHVRAVDTLTGSTSTWSAPWKVTVDNTAPTAPGSPILVSSVSPTSSTTVGQQVWSFSTSTDTLSGVSRYEYSVNSTTTWINNLLSTSITTALGIGTHTISVRAIDGANNTSPVASSTFTVTASSTVATSTPPVAPPVKASQCKRMGWKTFTNPSFKNQGKCVSFVEKSLRDIKKHENDLRKENKKHVANAHKKVTEREKVIRAISEKHNRMNRNNESVSTTTRNEHASLPNGSDHGNGNGKNNKRD